MSAIATIVRRLFTVSAIFLLAACGGGGGGGDRGPGYSVSPDSLMFSASSTSSGIPAPQTITINVSGGTVYLAVAYSGPAIANATFSITGSTTGIVTVYPASPASLGTGFHTGTVRIVGCNDANCNSQVSGSPKDVAVSYQITNLSASPASVNLSALVNTVPTSVPVQLSSSVASGGWSSSISYVGATTGWLTLNPANGSPLPVTVNFSAVSLTVPGTYRANVTITSGSQVRVIPVTYIVTTDLIATPASVSLSAVATTVPAAVPVVISVSSSASAAWSSAISYVGTTTGWLALSPANGSSLPATVNFNAVALTVPGTYTANVTITSGSQVRVIPVTYVVSRALSPSPTTLTYTIGNAPAPADLTRQVSIGATAGITWTAASSVNWLSVSPISGGVGGTLTAALVQAQLDALNNGTYSGSILLTPSAGAAETIAVTLTVSRTQVNYVAPYVAVSNTSAEVIVRGENFNLVSVQNVRFGNTNAASFTVVSNTEIRATHPLLAAGSYRVQLESSLGISRSLASLAVVDAPIYAAATIPYPNVVSKFPVEILYDAERQALVVVVQHLLTGAPQEILRYSYSGSAWATLPTSRATSRMRDFSLSSDGQNLLEVSDYSITQLNPVTFVAGTVTSAPFTSFYYLKGLALANDGAAIVTTGLNGSGYTQAYRYTERNPALSPIGSSSNLYFGTPSASKDGSRVVIVQGGLSPAPRVVQYSASTGTLSTTTLALNQNAVAPELDRTARRILMNGYLVYDANYVYLGSLPTPVSSSVAIALSPDGTRAYSYSSGTILRTYDLTGTPVAGVFPEVGTGITLASDPGGSNAKMTITPDGGTIFIAGSSAIVVQPVR